MHNGLRLIPLSPNWVRRFRMRMLRIPCAVPVQFLFSLEDSGKWAAVVFGHVAQCGLCRGNSIQRLSTLRFRST